MSSEFDDAVSRSLQASTAGAARVGFASAVDVSPDAYAEAQRIARRTGMPVDSVLAYPQDAKREAAVGSIDFDTLAATSPATAALLADVEKAKISHDDVQNLQDTENVLKAWQGPKPTFASVSGGLAEALKFKPLTASLRLAFNDMLFGTGGTPEDQVRRADLVRKAGQAQAQQDYTTPAFESSTAAGLYSGGVSILQNLPGLAASIMTGSPVPGLALAGINSAVPAYGKYSARGATVGEAAAGALAEGTVEVATEALPMGFFVSKFGKAGFGEFLSGMLGREVLSEQAATFLQDAVDTAVANPYKTWTQFFNERPEAAYQTLIATLLQSGLMGGASKIVQIASGRAAQADAAEAQAQQIERINQAVAASKVLQRDPQTFEQFIATASESSPVQTVFIDAKTLLQTGMADQVAAASPAVAAQLQDAAVTGGQIAIPVAEYAAKIAPTESAGVLLDHLRTDPEGFSRAEAQRYMQEQAQELKAEVARVVRDHEADSTFKADMEAMKATIRAQLDAAGRFTPEAHDAYATLVGNFYAVQAAKLGITPQELYQRYPITVTAEGMGGQTFDQGPSYYSVLADAEDSGGIASVEREAARIASENPSSTQDVATALRDLGHRSLAERLLDGRLVKATNGASIDLGVESGSPMQDKGSGIETVPGDGSDGIRAGREGVAVKAPVSGGINGDGAHDSSLRKVTGGQSVAKNADEINAEGSKQWALDAYLSGSVPDGWYTHGRAGRKDLNTNNVIQLTKSFDTADFYAGDNGSVWLIRPKEGANTLDMSSGDTADMDRVVKAAVEDFNRGGLKWDSDLENALGRDVDENDIEDAVRSQFAPEDIVNSAQAYDDPGMSEWLADRFGFPSFVYTPDGAVVFSREGIDAVMVPDDRGASVGSDVFNQGPRGAFVAGMDDENNVAGNQAPAPAGDVQEGGVNESDQHLDWIEFLKARRLEEKDGKIFMSGGFEVSRSLIESAFAEDQNILSVVKVRARRLKDNNPLSPENSGVWYHGSKTPNLSKITTQEFGSNGFDNITTGDRGMTPAIYLTSEADHAAVYGNFIYKVDLNYDGAVVVDARADLQDAAESSGFENVQDYINDIYDGNVYEAYDADLAFDSALKSAKSSGKSIIIFDFGDIYSKVNADEGDHPIGKVAVVADETAISVREMLVNSTRPPRNESSASAGSDVLNQGPRGAFSPATFRISLLKNADLSTFLHETGHAFLEMQIDMAARLAAIDELTPGEREITADAQALMAWFGLRDIAEWQSLDFEERRDYHEKFARGFEAYLFEGKAPSIELQSLFQRFRAWLTNIYRELKALNVELTDEVRGVMDRMIATNEQIRLAEMGRSMMPMFETAEQAGMTPEEFAAYHALGVQATADAIEDLQARGLRDMQWLTNAKGREIARLKKLANEARNEIEMGARSEVMAKPVYQAWQFLTGKIDPAQEEVTAGRFDAGALAAIGVPDEVVQTLKARRMVAKEGWHPDLLAERFGFDSGDALARALAAANPPKEEIDALTEQRMLEQNGELATPDAIERAADAAIHNDARARMVATEANALAAAVGQRKILTAAAKEYAAALIGRLKIGEIRPNLYATAAARAGRAAQKALREGNLELAAAEKRNQLIQTLAAKAATEAREEVTSTLRGFNEFANRPDKRLGKTYDLDIANAARAILGEYGIAEKRAKKAGEYLNAVESYDPELYGVLKPSLDAVEANAKPAKELTVDELRALRDEVGAMIHLARRSRQMEIDGDLLDREEVEAALYARLEAIGIPDTIPGEGQAVTPEEAKIAKIRTFLASARRVESWVGGIDGGEGVGPFRRYVFSRVKDAADAYRTDKAQYLREFRDLFGTIAPSLKPQLIAAPELGYTFGKDSGGSAMNEILHAILHTGNASNKRKLLLGRNWAQELPGGALDTSRWDAFISRLIAEGKLTRAHFDFAQGVWDLLERTKPAAQKTHRDVFGRYFDEVTAEPFSTPWGEYRGGYVPAVADARVVMDANLRALAEVDNAAMAFAFPTTAKGFTKARVEYNRPLTLDLRTLAQHIDKVLLFAHMEMPVRDVQRVLSRKVGQALGRIDPAAIPAMITPWLNRAAKQQVETPIAGSAGLMRFFSVMRARAGAAAMFANVANAAQQITGFSLAAVKVRPRLMLSAAAEYLHAPRKMAEAVAAASPYMAARMDNEVAAMTGEINDILLNPSLIEQGQNWTMRHAYFLQSAVDNVMGPIIWTAAYNQAIERGETERDAVRLADAAIRETQGSTQPEDISRIEAGNAFVRLFTQFAGYFNMQANLLGTEFVKMARDGGLRANAGRGLFVLAAGFYAPAIVAEAIMQAFRGGPDDADKDGEYLDDWIAALFGWAPLRNATAMAPVVGQGANALVNAANSKPYDDRMATSPAVSMLESAARAPVSVGKALAGEGSAQKAVRDVATLISMTVGLPANLAARPIGYAAGVMDGKIDPTGPVDAARGAITGTASPESKR